MAERWRLPSEPSGPRPRVLVVDDSRGVRQVVGQALGLAGFDVDLAGSPTEALSALAGQRYNAIVMDYVMPTMDGATLVRKARDLGITAPIVVMSGQATERDRDRAVAAGADAYFDKNDVRRGALAAALRNLVAAKPAGGGR
jgi:CheY-like chemotaxis protein